MKISDREKKFLIIGGIAACVILLYYAYEMFSDFRKRTDDFSEARLVTLEKQLNRIAEKDGIEKHLAELKLGLEAQEKAVLQGDKPPVAAAELSRILREAASTQGVNIVMERTLDPSEVHNYTAVPVEIGFNATTDKLKEILYSLRTSPYLLNVSEIKIRVTNIVKPVDSYTSMVVTGYIKEAVEPAAAGPESKKEKKNTEQSKLKTEEKDIK